MHPAGDEPGADSAPAEACPGVCPGAMCMAARVSPGTRLLGSSGGTTGHSSRCCLVPAGLCSPSMQLLGKAPAGLSSLMFFSWCWHEDKRANGNRGGPMRPHLGRGSRGTCLGLWAKASHVTKRKARGRENLPPKSHTARAGNAVRGEGWGLVLCSTFVCTCLCLHKLTHVRAKGSRMRVTAGCFPCAEAPVTCVHV